MTDRGIRSAIRVWWRPAACVTLVAGTLINIIVLPAVMVEPIDLSGLAAVIASYATIFAVREWGKIKGVE